MKKSCLKQKSFLNKGSFSVKSGRPGSNRQPLAWKAKALPLSYRRNLCKQIYKKTIIYKGIFKSYCDFLSILLNFLSFYKQIKRLHNLLQNARSRQMPNRPSDGTRINEDIRISPIQIGRASCRERV